MASKKVIKFFATWCGPCKVYGKVWDKITPSYADQIQFVDIDIDKDTTGLANKLKIESVPSTVLIREDGSQLKKVGRLSTEELTELILS
tara:strand:+ start:1151 stop:1417 length:267 start_codon:yes stop_codon:yes gene_type:complete